MTKIISNLIEAHIIIKDKKQLKYLILKRAQNEIFPNIWQVVTGKIEKNETAVNAALREIKEETNIIPDEFFVVPKINSIYIPLSDTIIHVPVFAAYCNSKVRIQLSDEHIEYKLVNATDAQKLLKWNTQSEIVKLLSYYWKNGLEKVKLEKII